VALVVEDEVFGAFGEALGDDVRVECVVTAAPSPSV
jgi:hypothetical protein